MTLIIPFPCAIMLPNLSKTSTKNNQLSYATKNN
jgi:hypothetical protein